MRAVGRPRATARTVVCLPLLAAACGYTAGMNVGVGDARTVAIEVAGNETFRQRFEIPLTSQLYAILPLHTGLVPGSFRTSDAVLTVTIEDVKTHSLVQGTNQQPVLEGSLEYTVRVVLRNRRSGAVIRDRRVNDAAEFRTSIGQTEETAVAEASMDLARKIALALEPDF